jgi:hypothetical protein
LRIGFKKGRPFNSAEIADARRAARVDPMIALRYE